MRTFLFLLFSTSSLLFAEPETESRFFDGTSLEGWSGGEMKYWSVKDKIITGNATENVPRNEFLWSKIEVRDFYLVVDVKLKPNNRNAGIQFRSKPVNDHGQALGYQADVGAGVWGKLYHEHGRGKLDWNNRGDSAVKPDDWNRYEILAVGHRIWTAINGTLCVAINDPEGELSGKISFQIHGGPPQNVQYRPVKLIHNPEIALEKQTRQELLNALPKAVIKNDPKPVKSAGTDSVENRKGWTEQIAKWRGVVDANDLGMAEKWYVSGTDDSKWKTMSLPGFYESSGLPGHDGTAWFRREVIVPEGLAGKELTLELGPIDDMDMAWFNGTQVGGIEVPGFWLKPRIYKVPGKLVKAGKNVIAVRVIDHGYGGGFGAQNARALKLSAGKKAPIFLHGGWKYHVGVSLQTLGLGELKNPAQHWQPGIDASKSGTFVILNPLASPVSEPKTFVERFEIESDQNIVIFGGANAAECNRNGWLETRLVMAFHEHKIRFRNLAWPTDTVFEQWRPRNFFSSANPGYGEKDGREPIHADIAFLWFGQMESLGGEAKLNDFKAAYESLIDEVSAHTGRIVLVTPAPFSDPLDLGLNLEKRNADLEKYAAVIRKIATNRKLLLADLTRDLKSKSISNDGALLSENGHSLAAQEIALNLRFSYRLPKHTQYLRESIQHKNALWRQYWMPSNWAFLYGNRQSQPSSRDHANPKKRWFPEEIKATLSKIEKLEDDIHSAAEK